MTTISTACAHCGEVLHLEARFVDKNLRCPRCKGVFLVSNISASVPFETQENQQALVTRSEPAEISEPGLAPPNARPGNPQESMTSESSQTRRQSSDPPLGNIGRYKLLRELGRGAFGIVYAGEDPVLKRDVAIKLQSKIEADGDHAALLAEARAAARLRHPNLVAVYEAGAHEGQPFVVSELIPGETLANRIQEGPLDQKEAAVLVRDLARGMAHAHEQRLVHRDIKPQNVLIGEGGRPQIADFGLAVDRRDEDQARQQAYSRSGTLAYVSPEQAGIGGVSVGPASDQYALGATLFETLTGERPHIGDSLEILRGLEAPHPPRARDRNPKVAVDLDAICYKAMAHDAWQRYVNCAEFANDLDRYLAGDLIHGRRIGLVERARHFSKRNPRLAGWTVAGVMAAVSLITLSTISAIRSLNDVRFLQRESEQRGQIIQQSLLTLSNDISSGRNVGDNQFTPTSTPTREQPPTPAISDELPGWVAYSRKLNKASRSIDRSETQAAQSLLSELRPEYRHWEFNYLSHTTAPTLVQWTNLSSDEISRSDEPFSLTPILGSSGIALDSGGNISIRDLTSGNELLTTRITFRQNHGDRVQLFPIPSRNLFAFLDGPRIRFWDFRNSKELPAIELGQRQLGNLSVSDDDRWLAGYDWTTHTLNLWDSVDLSLRQSISATPQTLVFTPGSEFALFLTDALQVVRLTLADMSASVIMSLPANTTILTTSESMRELYCLSADRRIRAYPVIPLYPPSDLSAEVPHSSSMVIAEPDEATRLIAFPKGQEIQLFRNGQFIRLSLPAHCYLAHRHPLAFHARGRILLASIYDTRLSKPRVLLWDTDRLSTSTSELPQPGGYLTSLSAAPDETHIAAGYVDGRLTLWDQVTREVAWTIKADFGPIHAVAHHPRGSTLATAGGEGVIRFWSASDGQQVGEWNELGFQVHALAFSPDGQYLVAGLSDESASGVANLGLESTQTGPADIIVFSAADGKEIQRWRNHYSRVNSIAFHPSGRDVFTSGDDGQVFRWQIGTAEPLGSYRCPGESATELRVSPDGNAIVFVTSVGREQLVPQTHTVSFTVCKPVMEMKTIQVTQQIMTSRWQDVTRVVCYDGVARTETGKIMRSVPETITKEIPVTVTKYVIEEHQRTHTVYVRELIGGPIEGTVKDRPRVIMLSAENLHELGRWYPEGEGTPITPEFVPDGRRLFVSTDRGVSVLHPHYLFELVELRPLHLKTLRQSGADGTGYSSGIGHFSKLSFSEYHQQLCVALGEQLVWLREWPDPDPSYWETLAGRLQPEKNPRANPSDDPSASQSLPIANSDTIATVNLEPFTIPVSSDNTQTVAPEHDTVRPLSDIASDAPAVFLSELEFELMEAGAFGPARNRHPPGKFVLAGQEFENGLSAHAPSRYVLPLGPGWSTFTTKFGIQDDHDGSVAFVVKGDGKTLYRSGIIRDRCLHGVKLDVRGVNVLELVSEPVDNGIHHDWGMWLEPQLHRQLLPDTYALEFDELRIVGENVDLCEIKLSAQGLELIGVRYSEPTFHVNGVSWNPTSQPRLPNTQKQRFFSDDVDFSRARIHAYGVNAFADLKYGYFHDSVRIRFVYPPSGSTRYELIVQIPRKAVIPATVDTAPNWTGNWKVAGYAYEPTDSQSPPTDIPPKNTRPFAVIDCEYIDWSWMNWLAPLPHTPDDYFVIIGQRKFKSDGGVYRIETLADDGVRVKVNNRLVIDNWGHQSVTQDVAMVKLGAGEHTVRVEYYDNMGRSRLGVSIRNVEPRGSDLDRKQGEPPTNARTEAITQLRSAGAIVFEEFNAPRLEVREITFHEVKEGLNDELFSLIRLFPELRGLSVTAPHQITEDGWNHLSSLVNLQQLDLHGAGITSKQLEAITKLPNVEVLSIGANAIGDSDMTLIPRLLHLRELHLFYLNRVTDASVETLSSVPKLKAVSVHGTGISDEGAARLAKLKGL
jgi:serine/threonine protein kinase/phage FluMu protein Com